MSTENETIDEKPVNQEMLDASKAFHDAAEKVRELWGDARTIEEIGDYLYDFPTAEDQRYRLNDLALELWSFAKEVRKSPAT